jgi:hypothetical protein
MGIDSSYQGRGVQITVMKLSRLRQPLQSDPPLPVTTLHSRKRIPIAARQPPPDIAAQQRNIDLMQELGVIRQRVAEVDVGSHVDLSYLKAAKKRF